jgi:nucleoid-associated protein YgaU
VVSYEPIQPTADETDDTDETVGSTQDRSPVVTGADSPDGPLKVGSSPSDERPSLDRTESPAVGGPGQMAADADRTPSETTEAPTVPAASDMPGRLDGLTPAPSADSTYTIERGDTLIAIAREHYGEDRHWTAIRDANPDVDPLGLQPGQTIVLPPREQVLRSAARPAAGEERAAPRMDVQSTYVVTRGDTLISIAREVLQDASRYREIFELNQDKLESPDLVIEGMKLRMPPLQDKVVEDDDEPETGD